MEVARGDWCQLNVKGIATAYCLTRIAQILPPDSRGEPEHSLSSPFLTAGLFHSQENQAFVGAVPPCPPPPTDDFMGISGIGATTGGLPLQENETALLLNGDARGIETRV